MADFLKDRVALVTGASRGIGAATAKALAAAGAHVILTARSVPDLEAVENAIHEAGGSATIAPLDLTEGDSVAKLGAAVAGRWPALDIMVLNAAMLGPMTPVPQIDGTTLAKTFTLNVLAQQALIAAFDPLLRKSDAGRLIAVSSGVARNPKAYWGAYSASKAALETLVLSYADEVQNLAPLKVAIVNPGATRTAMRAEAYPGEDPATLKAPDVAGEAIVALLKGDFETGHRLNLGARG
jgi:NAD(P)-dependent dehydrogenase (short-subunit alcohol dehydrogenase family)